MAFDEKVIEEIVSQVVAKDQLSKTLDNKNGIFQDMNEAIAAAEKAQKIVRNLS